MANMLKLGAKKDGSPWDEHGNTEIVQILISYDEDTIKSIQFVYAAKPDGVRPSQVYGELTGSNFNSVIFDYPSEFLTCVRGAYVSNATNGRLLSIVFDTNKRSYGPFGEWWNKWESKFNYKFGATGFGGFHGTVDNNCVFSIGVYLKTIQTLNPIANAPK